MKIQDRSLLGMLNTPKNTQAHFMKVFSESLSAVEEEKIYGQAADTYATQMETKAVETAKLPALLAAHAFNHAKEELSPLAPWLGRARAEAAKSNPRMASLVSLLDASSQFMESLLRNQPKPTSPVDTPTMGEAIEAPAEAAWPSFFTLTIPWASAT